MSSSLSLSSLQRSKEAIHDRFLAAFRALQVEERTYAERYGQQAPIEQKSSGLQQRFNHSLALLTDALDIMQQQKQPHDHQQPTPPLPSLSPPSPPRSPRLSLSPSIPPPPRSPPAPSRPSASTASLDALASTLAAELAERHRFLDGQQLDDEEAERVLHKLREHKRRLEERDERDSDGAREQRARDEERRQEQLALRVTQAELELERRRRADREREERGTREQQSADATARAAVLDERWSERERLMREELRTRVVQWEAEQRGRDERWKTERDRLAGLLQKERDCRELEKRQADEERRETQRLYDLQLKRLTRQIEDEREELRRERRAEKARDEEERRRRKEEDEDDRRARVEKAEREAGERRAEKERAVVELLAMEQKLRDVSEHVKAMAADKESRDDERRKESERIAQLEQEVHRWQLLKEEAEAAGRQVAAAADERARQLQQSSRVAEMEIALRDSHAEAARLTLQVQRLTSMRAADLRLFHSQVNALHDLHLQKRQAAASTLLPSQQRSAAILAVPHSDPHARTAPGGQRTQRTEEADAARRGVERQPPLSLSQLAAAVHV